MAKAMYIVTGSTGVAHVTPIDDAIRNSNMGYYSDKVVFSVLESFAAQALTQNSVRISSGYGMNQGRLFKINENTYEDVTIENGQQGAKRADLIVARYTFDTQTGFEDISLAVIKGSAGAEYVDPSYTTGNINEGATLDDFPLYRIKLNGLALDGDPEPLFTLLPEGGRIGELEKRLDSDILVDLASNSKGNLDGSDNVDIGVKNKLKLENGGTGANTAAGAAKNIFIDALVADSTDISDSTEIPTSEHNGGFSANIYKRTALKLWNYIQTKIKTLLGMGNTEIVSVSHGGTGKASITSGKVLVGNGTSTPTEKAIVTSLTSSNDDIPTAKAVSDALVEGGYGDMLKSTFCNTGADVIKKAAGGTGSTDGSLNGVMLGTQTSGGVTSYGYYAGSTFKSFRQPTGNAGVGQVVKGYTFANASSDALTGTFEAQEKTVTASRSAQAVTPDSGKYLSKVTVNKYPDANGTYTCPSNWTGSPSAGGNGDMGVSNNTRYVNATNVYNKGKADAESVQWTTPEMPMNMHGNYTAMVPSLGNVYDLTNVVNVKVRNVGGTTLGWRKLKSNMSTTEENGTFGNGSTINLGVTATEQYLFISPLGDGDLSTDGRAYIQFTYQCKKFH